MPSKLQIVNYALAELGRVSETSINNSDDAKYLSARIDQLYPQLLLACNWEWAVAYKEDDTPLTEQYSPEFTYAYQLPGDFGKLYRFGNYSAVFGNYMFADGLLLANARPVRYYYISNQASYDNMSPLFADALALYAASKSALVLTNNTQLTGYLKQEYEQALVKAIQENDMRRDVLTNPGNDFNRVTWV